MEDSDKFAGLRDKFSTPPPISEYSVGIYYPKRIPPKGVVPPTALICSRCQLSALLHPLSSGPKSKAKAGAPEVVDVTGGDPDPLSEEVEPPSENHAAPESPSDVVEVVPDPVDESPFFFSVGGEIPSFCRDEILQADPSKSLLDLKLALFQPKQFQSSLALYGPTSTEGTVLQLSGFMAFSAARRHLETMEGDHSVFLNCRLHRLPKQDHPLDLAFRVRTEVLLKALKTPEHYTCERTPTLFLPFVESKFMPNGNCVQSEAATPSAIMEFVALTYTNQTLNVVVDAYVLCQCGLHWIPLARLEPDLALPPGTTVAVRPRCPSDMLLEEKSSPQKVKLTPPGAKAPILPGGNLPPVAQDMEMCGPNVRYKPPSTSCCEGSYARAPLSSRQDPWQFGLIRRCLGPALMGCLMPSSYQTLLESCCYSLSLPPSPPCISVTLLGSSLSLKGWWAIPRCSMTPITM